ncbi:uncharacterized protein LOC121346541, partial [Onychostruthus taczanowskii]|uniref:uncharacterized protein LOC121346541 n=1 Tax=Onychostruthus taczanowskii TaxID=356909 RepID=UPI001B800C86
WTRHEQAEFLSVASHLGCFWGFLGVSFSILWPFFSILWPFFAVFSPFLTVFPVFHPAARWTRREQADFLRVASSFGVELEPGSGRFRWGRFRALAGLERRSDEELTRFYHGFVAMCRQVCRLPPAPGDVPPAVSPAPLACPPRRLWLLRCLRERVLPLTPFAPFEPMPDAVPPAVSPAPLAVPHFNPFCAIFNSIFNHFDAIFNPFDA